jgi:anthranilate phosphoribosyltransferase
VNATAANNSLAQSIDRVSRGERLGEERTALVFGQLMRGEATHAQIADLLLGLKAQGETGEEVAGAVRAMREAMVKVTPPAARRPHLIDTCGTGGGTVPTFNVSTAAAFVAVGAGAAVAKHGNRSFTSKCGSADLLEAFGIELTIDAGRATSLLEAASMAFLWSARSSAFRRS